MRMLMRWGGWRLVAAASGTTLFLQGCDPDTRAAVEDGIINSSSSLLGAFLRATIEVVGEGADSASARVITEAVQVLVA